MPELMAWAHEKGRAADRPANRALVDQFSRRLMRAAQKCVGRATDPQASSAGGVDQLARLGDVDAERLFRMNMLARGDRLQADLDMRFGNGEIDDDLDRGIGEKRVDRSRLQPKFTGARLGRPRIGVRQRDDVEDRKAFRGFQIGRADIAAADDADADALQFKSPAFEPSIPRLAAGPVVPHGAP